MSDKANHEKLADEGLIHGDLSDHHRDAINSLSAEESDQLVSLLKKAKAAVPDDKKHDIPNIF